MELRVQVGDADRLVVGDCGLAIVDALRRHGFHPVVPGSGSVTGTIVTEIEVLFADGLTADITALVYATSPPQRVMASAGAGYYELPSADLRSRGARYRTQNCAVAAERLAIGMVETFGADTGVHPAPGIAPSHL